MRGRLWVGLPGRSTLCPAKKVTCGPHSGVRGRRKYRAAGGIARVVESQMNPCWWESVDAAATGERKFSPLTLTAMVVRIASGDE